MLMEGEFRRTLQLAELDILKEFKRICEEHNLRYFAIGGTCLGAVRHQGFIPWDDDIDVAMPYEDYVRFIEIAKSGLRKPYELFDPVDHEVCGFTFLKMHNSNTAFIEKVREAYTDSYFGVFIDIMPIYGLPSEGHQRNKVYKKSSTYIRKNRISRYSFNKTASLKQKLVWITCFPGRVSGDCSYYLKKLRTLGDKCDFEAAKDVLFAWRPIYYDKNITYKREFDKDVFRDYCNLRFEDTEIRVPIDYDKYLTRDFGDYMKLPPEEKRVTLHPAAVIDLHKSYKQYAKEYQKKK